MIVLSILVILYNIFLSNPFLIEYIMRKIVNHSLTFIALVIAVYLVYLMLTRKEKFGVPEFIDREDQDRTVRSWYSSYEQKTNHLPPFDSGRHLVGEKTGHRVKQ